MPSIPVADVGSAVKIEDLINSSLMDICGIESNWYLRLFLDGNFDSKC